MSAKEVLADLFEEVTGDPEKRWPPEWMAIQVAKAKPALEETAIALAVEAGGNERVIDRSRNPNLRVTPYSPIWYPVKIDRESRLFIDLTEQFEPEFEIALRAEAEDFPEDDLDGAYIGPGVAVYHVYRIVLDQLEPGVLRIGGPPHIAVPVFKGTDRTPQFATLIALKDAARNVPTSATRLREALYSANPWRRVWAYSIIADHHGFDTFDDNPVLISGRELRERWTRKGVALYRPAKGQPLRYREH